MKVKVRISLVNDNGQSFMGIGIVTLLRGVEKYNSIRRAAGEMGMSYAKAHRILCELEDNLGKKVLSRRVGGPEGGGARLTSFGSEFLRRYEDFLTRCENFVKGEFRSLRSFIEGKDL